MIQLLLNLAIIPIGSRRGVVQIALAFLPFIVLGLLILIVVAGCLRGLPRGWRRSRLPYTCVVLAALAAAVWWAWPGSCRRAAPPVSGSAPPEAAGWTTFMGGPARRGSIEAAEGPARGNQLWAVRDGVSPYAGSPAVWADRVFVGSDNRQLYCLDARDGRIVWKFRAAAELFASPAVDAERVYFGEGLHETQNAKVYCLNARNGEKVWEFQTRSHAEFSPTLAHGRLYVAAGDDGVYCLDARNGERIWQHSGLHVDMSPAVAADGVFVGSAYGTPLFRRLRAEDGTPVWTTLAPMAVRGSPSIDGPRVYFGLGNGTFAMSHASPLGAVICLEAATGAILWTTDYVRDAVLTTVAVTGDRAFFGSRDGHVYGADALTGRKIWEFDAGDPVVSSPAVAGKRVYFGGDSGAIYCLDAGSGQRLWTYDSSRLAFNESRILGSPALANGRLYAGSMNFFFFCLGE